MKMVVVVMIHIYLNYYYPEEDGHGHVMCGLITFHSTVNGEMYGESGSF